MRAKIKEKLMSALMAKFPPDNMVGMDAEQVARFREDLAEMMIDQVMSAMSTTWTKLAAMVQSLPIKPAPLRPGETVQNYIGKDRRFVAEQLQAYWVKMGTEMGKIGGDDAEKSGSANAAG